MSVTSGTTLSRMLKGVLLSVSAEDTQLAEFLELERTIQNELNANESISSNAFSGKPPLAIQIASNSNQLSRKALPPNSIRLQSPSMNDLGDSFKAFNDCTATEVRLN